LPDSVGKQSTSPPILIYPGDDKIIEYELPVDIQKPKKFIDKIEWRTKTAIKSTKLTIQDVKDLITDKHEKNKKYLANARGNGQYKRMQSINDRIDEIEKQKKQVNRLIKEHKDKNLICHKISGTGLILKFKHKKLSYTTSIQHICITPGHQETIFKEAHKRPNKKSNLDLIEQIGPYLIYSCYDK